MKMTSNKAAAQHQRQSTGTDRHHDPGQHQGMGHRIRRQVRTAISQGDKGEKYAGAADVDGQHPTEHGPVKQSATQPRREQPGAGQSVDDLWGLFEEDKHKAGIHQILDPEAVRILQRSKTKTIVVNGFKPENVQLAVRGEQVGTLMRRNHGSR